MIAISKKLVFCSQEELQFVLHAKNNVVIMENHLKVLQALRQIGPKQEFKNQNGLPEPKTVCNRCPEIKIIILIV